MWVSDLTMEGKDILSGHLLALMLIKIKTKTVQILPVNCYQPGSGMRIQNQVSLPDSIGTAPGEGIPH